MSEELSFKCFIGWPIYDTCYEYDKNSFLSNTELPDKTTLKMRLSWIN